MMRSYIPIVWLCSLSLLLVFGCKGRKTSKTKPMPKLEAAPVPLEESQTDSLKRILDAERENRIKKKSQ